MKSKNPIVKFKLKDLSITVKNANHPSTDAYWYLLGARDRTQEESFARLRGGKKVPTVYKIPEWAKKHVCGDCSAPAQCVVIEEDGMIWFYCGVCEVG